MIYFITGESKKCFEKTEQLVEAMLNKKPDAEVYHVGVEGFDIAKLEEMIGGQSLFSKKYIVKITRILESTGVADVVLNKIKEIQESENIFIWVEPEVKKLQFKQIKKIAEEVQEFKVVTSISKRDIEIFKLSDAFGRRDPKLLWILYLKQIRKSAAEEIHGTIWWQLKSMVLASKSNNAKEAGLASFVFSKSKKFSENYSQEELSKMSDILVEIYHEAHRGGANLETRLEEFVLSLV